MFNYLGIGLAWISYSLHSPQDYSQALAVATGYMCMENIYLPQCCQGKYSAHEGVMVL
jgi:hypothetical protein